MSEETATVQVEELDRAFKMGSILLDDPAPDESPEDALAYYYPAYPSLRHCTLGDPEFEDGVYVYPIHKPAATTKGASAQHLKEAEQALEAWAGQVGDLHSREQLAVEQAWGRGLPVIERIAHRPVCPEAFIPEDIPLA